MAIVNSSRFNFADVVRSELTKYGTQVQEEVFEVIPDVAKEAAKKLRKESPKGATGKYARGWTSTVDKGRLKSGATVHGKKPETYAVAHLLEKSHALRGGGRYNPESNKAGKSTVHIAPVEQWAIDEAYERILQRLEKRG